MNRYTIIIAIVALVVFAACSTEKPPTPPHEFEPSPFDNPPKTSKIEEKLKELAKPSYQLAVSATVTRVIDGDTVDVRLSDGSTDRVRLLGVDTPEIQSANKTEEYGGIANEQCLRQWGFAGKDYANNLLAGKSVSLVLDPIAGDRGTYGRLLAYVEIDGYDFSKLLVEYGFARAATEWSSSRVSSYLPYQEAAIASNTGLWSCR